MRVPAVCFSLYVMSAMPTYEACGLAGAFAPPALEGVDNATFAHRLRLPLRGPTAGQTALPTPRAPPNVYQSLFFTGQGKRRDAAKAAWLTTISPGKVNDLGQPAGGARRACPSGRAAARGGLGVPPPAVGAEGGAGRAGGFNATPSGGLVWYVWHVPHHTIPWPVD